MAANTTIPAASTTVAAAPSTLVITPPTAATIFTKRPESAQEYFDLCTAHSAWAKGLPEPHTAAIPTVQALPKAAVTRPLLQRAGDWQSRMHRFIDSRREMPFAWGSHDCGLFVCDHVQAMTAGSVDMAASVRGKYTDALGSAKAMAKACGSASLEDFVAWTAQQHGAVELANVAMVQRGDVVLFDGPDSPVLGYLHLSGKHVLFVSDKGLAAKDLLRYDAANKHVLNIRRAWRIG